MDKIKATINFYYKKLISVIDNALDNVVNTIASILGKIPKAIDDSYNILVANLNVPNAIALAVIYTVFEKSELLIRNPLALVILLGGAAMFVDKFKVK